MFVKKRGQITVFIILGLIMLIVFLFINRAANEVQKIKLEKQADDIKSNLEQSQAVQHYIKLCLKDSAEEGLTLIGQQGGRIWDYQGGNSNISKTPHLSVNSEGTPVDVAVGLTKPELNPPLNTDFPNVPYYPNTDYTLEYLQVDKSKLYYFGDNGFPKLCDKYGPNAYNLSKDSGASCTPLEESHGNIQNDKYVGTRSDTIQIQLENYTSNKLVQCVDSKFLKDFTGYDVAFEKPETVITFGEENIIVTSYFPIDIKIQNNESLFKTKETITKSAYFSAIIPVRLKRMFDLSYSLVDSDKSNITFSLLDNYKAKKSYLWLANQKENQTLSVDLSSLPDHKDTDLIKITDKDSLIAGKPYVFQFLRENRPPVLDLIRTYNGPGFDIVVSEGDVINFTPIGYDPDEDYYYTVPGCVDSSGDKCMGKDYNYSKWLETDAYSFNYTCCIQKFPGAPSNCFTDYPTGCVDRTGAEPHIWTTSTLYTATSRLSSYKTAKKDIGDHVVRVSVCDEHSICDWQDVKIRVYDLQNPVAQGTNFFNDLNQSYASVEDPYMLDAKSSFLLPPPTGVPSMVYKWSDDKEFPLGYIFLTPNVTLPNTSFSIDNITKPGFNFFNYGQPNAKKLTHELTLSLNSNTLSTDKMNVVVYQCLPHRNKPVASYPFNNFTGDDAFGKYSNGDDPFAADHTCCRDDGSNYGIFFDSSNNCYNLTTYAPYWGFNNSRFTYLKTEYDPNGFATYNVKWEFYNTLTSLNSFTSKISAQQANPLVFTPLPTISFPYDYTNSKNEYNNDVYSRYFETKCSGVRGNTCDGVSGEIREAKQVCSDDITTGQTEKCAGPNQQYFGNLISEDKSNFACVNYGVGDSFEKEMDRVKSLLPSTRSNDSVDGQCNENYKCVSLATYNPNSNPATSNTVFLGKGLCNGQGSCTYAYTTDNGKAYDGVNNPGTNYKYDKIPGTTWNADNTIDCRCFARSCEDGSFGNLDPKYDTYSAGKSCLNADYANTKRVTVSGKWSPLDNEADLINYSFSSTNVLIGNCTSGVIHTCGTSGGKDNCVIDSSISSKTVTNEFVYDSVNGFRLKQYLPQNTDGACGTKETCNDYIFIDPDTSQQVCDLLRYDKVVSGVLIGNKYMDDDGDDSDSETVNNGGNLQKKPYWYSETGATSYSPSIRQCCGDDNGEAKGITKVEGTLNTAITGSHDIFKGCKISTECVYNNNAYPAGTDNINVGGDTAPDYCDAGTWKDCNINDNQCDSSKWCVGVSSSDKTLTSSLSGNYDWHDCAPKISDGGKCNRDQQCNSGSFCTDDFSGVKRCTPPTSCYLGDGTPFARGKVHCGGNSGSVLTGYCNGGSPVGSSWVLSRCDLGNHCDASLVFYKNECVEGSTSSDNQCKYTQLYNCNEGIYAASSSCSSNTLTTVQSTCSSSTGCGTTTTTTSCGDYVSSCQNNACSGQCGTYQSDITSPVGCNGNYCKTKPSDAQCNANSCTSYFCTGTCGIGYAKTCNSCGGAYTCTQLVASLSVSMPDVRIDNLYDSEHNCYYKSCVYNVIVTNSGDISGTVWKRELVEDNGNLIASQIYNTLINPSQTINLGERYANSYCDRTGKYTVTVYDNNNKNIGSRSITCNP